MKIFMTSIILFITRDLEQLQCQIEWERFFKGILHVLHNIFSYSYLYISFAIDEKFKCNPVYENNLDAERYLKKRNPNFVLRYYHDKLFHLKITIDVCNFTKSVLYQQYMLFLISFV